MSAGKGDSPRPVIGKLYRKNWMKIFMKSGKRKAKSGKRKK